MNALKHGGYSEKTKEIRSELRRSRALLRAATGALNAQNLTVTDCNTLDKNLTEP